MIFTRVSIETPTVILPPTVVTSDELEQQLAPVYNRIGLRVGRLELMTGIHERRFWAPGTLPSQAAAMAGQQALAASDLPPEAIGCLINCSVSRDCVEPATSTFVHHALSLPPSAINFDISNACLGMVSGIITLASMIEAGFIEAGLAVSGEHAEPLVRNTIACLNQGDFNRQTIKPHFASLTIGSCATAVIVRKTPASAVATPLHSLTAAAISADTTNSHLCQGNANGGMTDASAPLMQTDSPELLVQGVALATHVWEQLKQTTGWNNDTPDVICTHQVGKGHRALLYETLHLDLTKDYSTFDRLGNCGSASLPATVALAAREGCLVAGQHIALLGIGSGINCCDLTVTW